MKKTIIISSIIIASIALTAGAVKAAGMSADWLRVGAQDEGGVTFFNGTIINETTGNNDADNPVTFGDNVRIDGRVYRGADAGTSDTLPFIINDNLEVSGSLTAGNITTNELIASENITVAGNITASGAVSWGTKTGHVSVSPNGCQPSYSTAAYSMSNLSLYPETTGTFYCPIQLPDGVTVTKVEMIAMDNNDNNLTLTLFRNSLRESSLGAYALAELSTSGNSSILQVVADSSPNFVVNNETYSYSYNLNFEDGDYSLRYSGLIITYIYTEPH